MARKRFTEEELRRATGSRPAGRIEALDDFTPVGIQDVLHELRGRLSSSGGRPTVREWTVQRKISFRKDTWARLMALARRHSRSGGALSPAQIAAAIVERALLDRKGALRASSLA